jgi:hypothetical protein
MSVVAVKITKTGYEMAADTQTTWYDTKMKTIKLFSAASGVDIGGAGETRGNQLMSLYAETHAPERSDELGILDWYVGFGKYTKDKTGIDFSPEANHFILGYKGNVWVIMDGYFVKRVTDNAAIGSGMFQAATAMHLGHSAEKAAEIACKLTVYCSGPLTVIKRKFNKEVTK